MNFHEQLIKWGIPTYFTTIKTTLPAAAQLQNNIAQTFPTQIGRIYGMSIYADTVTDDNLPLISTANAQNLYLNLKWGAANFIENIRLDDMLFNFAGVTGLAPTRYLPVNVPKDFNLDQSRYINPTLIPGPLNISLNLWYISTLTYNTMLKEGLVKINAIAPAGK